MRSEIQIQSPQRSPHIRIRSLSYSEVIDPTIYKWPAIIVLQMNMYLHAEKANDLSTDERKIGESLIHVPSHPGWLLQVQRKTRHYLPSIPDERKFADALGAQ